MYINLIVCKEEFKKYILNCLGGGPSQYFGGPDSTDPSNEIIQLNRLDNS